MAFMGLFMMYIIFFIIIIAVLVLLVTVFTILAIVFSRRGIKENSKKKHTAGKVFMVLDCMASFVLIVITAATVYSTFFEEIQLPNGETAVVRSSDVKRMVKIAESTDDDNIDELDELLTENPNLVYYVDSVYHYSILDMGAACGNYEVVETAVKHGVPIDDDRTFITGRNVDSDGKKRKTMITYLDSLEDRSITEDDAKIMSLLLDEGASTNITWNRGDSYSNIMGEVTWLVLYNGETVSDAEAELIQAMADNGCIKDSRLTTVYKSGGYSEYYGFDSDLDTAASGDNISKILHLSTSLDDEWIEEYINQ